MFDLTIKSKGIEKLFSTISNGFGRIYRPFAIKKEGKAEASAIRNISQAINESPVAVTYKDDTKEISNCIERNWYDESKSILGEKNRNDVIDYAIKELKDVNDVTDKLPSRTWIIRFLDEASNICEDELKYLWGRILAGEVKKPNSFSLRTLDTVKNLNLDEAELFQKIAPYFCEDENSSFIIDDQFLEEYGIKFEDEIILSNCGLLDMNPSIVFLLPTKSNKKIIANKDQTIEITSDNTIEGLPDKILTDVGVELLSIMDYKADASLIKKQLENIGCRCIIKDKS